MRANIKKISSCISLFFFQTNKQSQIQGFATFTVKQLLNLSRSNPYHLPPGLRQVSTERKDTEGNIIQLEALYELSNGYVAEAIDYLQSVYPNLRLVPIGGQSAGGGVFAVAKKSNEQQTVGLQILPPAAITDKQNITYTISDEAPTEAIRTQEIHILRAQKIAYVGAGVVLDQLQTTVHEALGKNFAVQGTDLKSSPYAR